MVIFKKVTKKFGSISALQDVSFSVNPGEFVFITGASGAGKTTILRLLLRELIPDSGEIIVAGKNIINLHSGDLPLYRRHLGMVFQDFKLLTDRTIEENVGLVLAVAGMPLEKRKTKVLEVLECVGLKEKADIFPLQLAGGELQRAVIARAIVCSPKLLLCDEPTGNLDPNTAWGIIELLEKIRSSGTTVIMATHNQEIVDKMRRRVIELNAGNITRDKHDAKYRD